MIGIFDFDIKREFLLAVPTLYSTSRKSAYLNMAVLMQWMFRSFMHAVIVIAVPMAIGVSADLPRDLSSRYLFGTMIFLAITLATTGVMLIHTSTYTSVHVALYSLDILGAILVISVLGWLPFYHPLFGLTEHLFGEPLLYVLAFIFIPVTVYVSEVFLLYLGREFWPSISILAQEVSFGRAKYSATQFAKILEQDLTSEEIEDDDIETVLEDLYTNEDIERMEASNIARFASSAPLVE